MSASAGAFVEENHLLPTGDVVARGVGVVRANGSHQFRARARRPPPLRLGPLERWTRRRCWGARGPRRWRRNHAFGPRSERAEVDAVAAVAVSPRGVPHVPAVAAVWIAARPLLICVGVRVALAKRRGAGRRELRAAAPIRPELDGTRGLQRRRRGRRAVAGRAAPARGWRAIARWWRHMHGCVPFTPAEQRPKVLLAREPPTGAGIGGCPIACTRSRRPHRRRCRLHAPKLRLDPNKGLAARRLDLGLVGECLEARDKDEEGKPY